MQAAKEMHSGYNQDINLPTLNHPHHSPPSDSLFKCTIDIWFIVILIPRPGDAEPVGGYVANELTVCQRIHWVQVIRTLAVNFTMQIPRFCRDVVEESIELLAASSKSPSTVAVAVTLSVCMTFSPGPATFKSTGAVVRKLSKVLKGWFSKKRLEDKTRRMTWPTWRGQRLGLFYSC